MGIAFITAKAERFQHQRDAAFEQELASSNLFSSQHEQVRHSYRFQALAEEVPSVGTRVLIHRSEGLIRAFHLNLPIGVAMEPDSSELTATMEASKTTALAGQIIEVRQLSGTFVVTLSGLGG